MVVNELIKTEESYLADLETLISVFVVPCRHVLNSQEQLDLYCNVEALKGLHEAVVSEMRVEAGKAAEQQDWGAIFERHVEAFRREYQLYTKNQERSHAVRSELEKSNVAFGELMRQAARLPQVRRQDLKSFLIKPVQRICKYPLLLRELSKAMDGAGVQNLEAKRHLGQAMNAMSDVLKDANDFMRTLRPKRAKQMSEELSKEEGNGNGAAVAAAAAAVVSCCFCGKPISSASESRVSEDKPYHAGLCYLRSLSQQVSLKAKEERSTVEKKTMQKKVVHRVKTEEENDLDRVLDRCANMAETFAVDSSFIIPNLVKTHSNDDDDNNDDDNEEIDPDP